VKINDESVGGKAVSPISSALLDQLVQEAACIVRRELGGHDICQIWADQNRILFRLTDGRTGDVEVAANWDVPKTALNTHAQLRNLVPSRVFFLPGTNEAGRQELK
jgi:hypothetical protein